MAGAGAAGPLPPARPSLFSYSWGCVTTLVMMIMKMMMIIYYYY